ncbi:MAG: hypothetical protein JWR02_1743 [Mucilaginibacter sp.]|nr:hypothetical protein [Mucilaginibacter sp.]
MTDQTNKKPELKIVRYFNAPKEVVFEAFANAEALAEWWGPAGMPLTVKSFDFTPGGKFHYKLEGKGQIMWGIFKYVTITRPELVEFISSFSDEDGNICKSPFPMDFPLEIFNELTLTDSNGRTTLTLQGHPINATPEQDATYNSITADMEKGFGNTFDQLERYLQSRFQLQQELKTDNKARVCTYLNFNGNTDEAFNFYRSVFKTEFAGKGIQRFGDLPVAEGQPPMSDEFKKLILHIELPLLGGHVLKATDAPESMGFKLVTGNNMHICLEPESREEANRLFNELSVDGIIDMPMQDMFYGAYYGAFADKFGINWMVNYIDITN